MLIQKIAIFILFLGPLVFFHELGHYLFARLFGVRIEVFSIGFGPKILRFKKGFTEYAISIIPLGGYVKMFGDDPLNSQTIDENDRKYSFTFQRKWARFWIVMGGPLANFILTFVIFVGLALVGEKVPEIKLGAVSQESFLFDKGFRTGDVVVKMNSQDVFTFTDIALDGDDQIETITVRRTDGIETLNVGVQGEAFIEELAKTPPLLRLPLVVDSFGKAYALGLDENVRFDISLEEMSQSEPTGKMYLFNVGEGFWKEGAQWEPRIKNLVNSMDFSFSEQDEFFKRLASLGYYPLDLVVDRIYEDSPAERAKLEPRDIIISLSGMPLYSFEQIRKTLQGAGEGEEASLTLIRSGQKVSAEILPQQIDQGGKKVKIIGIYSAGRFQKLSFVQTHPKGIVEAVVTGTQKTYQAIVKTLEGLKGLIIGDISLKNIGGPITIGKVASDSFNTSISYFLQIMALISVNLGIINLFPIPILDGGHIMFILLEVVNRKPLSRRKMEIAQQIGLSLLLMLMIGALFNDFSRLF